MSKFLNYGIPIAALASGAAFFLLLFHLGRLSALRPPVATQPPMNLHADDAKQLPRRSFIDKYSWDAGMTHADGSPIIVCRINSRVGIRWVKSSAATAILFGARGTVPLRYERAGIYFKIPLPTVLERGTAVGAEVPPGSSGEIEIAGDWLP